MSIHAESRFAPAPRALAWVLVLGLALGAPAARAASPAASLSGVVRSLDDQRPLAGARVFAGDPATGMVYPSEPTDAVGAFVIRDLPPATYEVAVEANSGLYLVGQRLPLSAGMNQAVGIAVGPPQAAEAAGEANAAGDPPPAGGGGGKGLWNNPLTAALLVFGVAVVLGIVIENATDDDDTVEEPSTPSEI